MADQNSSDTASAKKPLPAIAGPPRITGNLDPNTKAIMEWLLQMYSWLVTVFGQLDPANGLGAADAVEGLVDPARATAASAQQTANDAKTIAVSANNRSTANRKILRSFGTFTLSDTATSAEVTFATDAQQPNTTYTILATVQTYTGTPEFEAFVPIQFEKLKDKFTMHVTTAPGTGNAVTYAWHIRRNDEDE